MNNSAKLNYSKEYKSEDFDIRNNMNNFGVEVNVKLIVGATHLAYGNSLMLLKDNRVVHVVIHVEN